MFGVVISFIEHNNYLGFFQSTDKSLELFWIFYPHNVFSDKIIYFLSFFFNVENVLYFSAKNYGILCENLQQDGVLKCKHSDILKMFYWNKFLETKHFTIFSELLLA